MAYKILIVDDDHSICEILAYNLRSEGVEVCSAHSAEEALITLSVPFDLILLDVMMGGMSGYKMAETLRERRDTTPIIFLTAKDTENDMLTGFSVGGDDYIPKPFSIKEVVARVRAVLRRSTGAKDEHHASSRLIVCGDLQINPETKEVFVAGEPVQLTKTEMELLVLLVRSSDRVLSRSEIIEKVWSETPYITERTVDVHITRLRKKLGVCAPMLTNRSGYGYRFNPALLCD
ncbi:response regulator transcription factor [Porphyromonas gulae]|uniref:response regulator transcription factor n=1 Tax=Porphyromonas gulae TaxID=111105 RepID=UPI0026EDDD1B|nr:response regulator transcription factor [Porphyromonas gulae]